MVRNLICYHYICLFSKNECRKAFEISGCVLANHCCIIEKCSVIFFKYLKELPQKNLICN
uniref:Uncharacterized protein n=1 Tax=Strongyloides papillosus TaxID=174720 RepID=A0A0N5BW13_STREA